MGYQGAAGELSEFREFMVDTRRRLRELERPTGTQIASAVERLSSISPIAAAVAGTTSTAVSGTQWVINWYSTPTTPSVTFTTPYSTVLVTFGATLSCSAGTTYIAESILGIRVNGGTPDPTRFLAVSSDQPTAGGAPVNLSLAYLLSVTPNSPTTISLAYGCRKWTTTDLGDAEAADRFLVVSPIP